MTRTILAILVLTALSSCKREGAYYRTDDLKTHYHEGMCFVIYHPKSFGPQMVEVDCSKVAPPPRAEKSP